MSSVENLTVYSDPNIDGGWGWIVVFITFMIRVIIDGYIYTFGIFYVEHLKYYDTTGGAASLVMSILIGVTHLAGPIASGLVNKLGCRAVSFIGTALTTAGILLSLASPRVEYLYITLKKGKVRSNTGVAGRIGHFGGWLIPGWGRRGNSNRLSPHSSNLASWRIPSMNLGIGCGLIYLPTIVGVALHFEKKRAFAMGISMSGSGIALLVFAPLVEWLINYYYYWKGALLIVAGIIMNCFVLSFFYKTFKPVIHSPERPTDEASTSQVTVGNSTTTTLESEQSQTFSQSTQTHKKGEKIKGIYTIRSTAQCGTSTSAHHSGLMQKSDIFYSGSSSSLLNVSRHIQTMPSIVSRTVIQRKAWTVFKDIVAQMIGTSLLKNYSFLIFSFGTFLHYFGLIAPCVYLYHKAIQMEIATSRQASLLLSLMGVANTIGKIAIGYWADRTSVAVLCIYTWCLLISGFWNKISCVHLISGGSITLSSIVMPAHQLQTAYDFGFMNSVASFATNPDPNVDGGWGWVIVFITFVIHFIFDGFMYTFGIFYAEFLKYFESASGATSLVMAIFIGMCYTAGPIASGLINKYDCRVVSFIGIGIACTGLLLSLAVPALEFLYITIGLIAGIGFGLAYLPTIVSVALFFEKKRATAMGISMAGSGIGSLAFAPLMEALINYYHYWKGALLIAVGLILQCFVLSFFYRVLPPFDRKIRTDESSISAFPSRSVSRGVQTVESDESVSGTYIYARNTNKATAPGAMQNPDILYSGSSKALLFPPSGFSVGVGPCLQFTTVLGQMIGLSLFKNYVFLTFSCCTFLHYLGINTPCVYLYHKSLELGIATTTEASLLLSIMGVANTVGKVVFGFWADKTSINVLTLYTACMLLNGISMMMTSLIVDYYLMAFYSFVFGATWGASLSLSSIVLVKLLGMQRLNNAYGLFLLFTGLATSTGVPMTGKYRSKTYYSKSLYANNKKTFQAISFYNVSIHKLSTSPVFPLRDMFC
ncbi:Monocarboxylate transporter 14 like protein [Argiope bruennichi]|uniref:Monocarboxylate transporter 14 like protein n=1 Tax=Argiope bruennichi TaxID=94029 RepID=A0A8T0EXG8_ARGBR|nr:Monocarboxylate transporter 14 like protein [Argiope bruennichi]